MKYKIILFFMIAFAAAFGAFIGEYFSGSQYAFIAFLGKSAEFGFEQIDLNLIFFKMQLSLNFSIYVIQAIFLFLALLVTPKIDAMVKV
jgi:hypothetical protein